MGTLVFQATLGGSINLIGPNIAGTVNFTLPSADGTSGQALATNGSGTLAFSSFATLTSNTFSGSQTLSGGTANGVTYLNGSKVLTSGSALVFDGTNLASGGSTNKVTGLSGSGTGFTVQASAAPTIGIWDTSNASYVFSLGQIEADSYVWNGASGSLVFGVNNAEQMRLTSTGLGIGTSSPAAKLDVVGGGKFTGVAATGTNGITLGGTTTNWNRIYVSNTGGDAYFGVENSTGTAIGTSPYAAVFGTTSGTTSVQLITGAGGNLTLNALGNLGLGVTPSAWSAFKAFELVGGSIASAGSTAISLFQNAYYDGTNYIYKTTNPASRYQQNSGVHYWYNAPSGTAGNAITFTQAMTLDASGNLLVGTTTKNNMNGTLLQTLGSSGIVDSSSASVAQNGTLVLTAAGSGASFTGFLSVSNVLVSNANIRTQTLYAIMGRGTTFTATQLATANGSTSGASFTVTCPSTGAITVTNTYAGATLVNMTYIGHSGG